MSTKHKTRGMSMILATAVLAMCAQLPAVAAERHQFDLRRQDASAAIHDFGRQTGIQILADSGRLLGKRFNAVRGERTTEDALRLMLAGTGMTHQYVGERSVALLTQDAAANAVETSPPHSSATGRPVESSSPRIRLAQAEQTSLEEVTVFGRNITRTRDIPQIVTVLDRTALESVAAVSLPEVLRFIPTASNLVSEFAPAGSNFSIRGFGTSSTWNGMSLRSINQNPDLANVERVEVLMGPSSVLYGSMEPGAVINIVTKQPRRDYHLEVMAEYGRFDKQHATLDVGGPFSDAVRARLNVSYIEEGAPFDHWKYEGLLIAPVVHFDLSESTTLIVEGGYRRSDYPYGGYDGRRPVIGTLRPNPLGEIPMSFNPSYEPDVTFGEWASTDVSARLAHQLTETFSINAALAYTAGERDRVQVFPLVLQADNRTLTRNMTIDKDSKSTDKSAHLDLRGEFATGPVRHRFAIGADYRDFPQENHTRVINTTSIDLFAPVTGTVVLPSPLPMPTANVELQTKEGFIQDRVQFGERFNVLLGARYTDFYQSSVTTPIGGGPMPAQIIDTDAWSTQAGLVYEATDALSLFASRNTSFVPRPGNSLGTNAMDPERGLQYEAGAKIDLGARGLTMNVAVFYIEKPNVLTVDGTNPNLMVPLGAVESRGIELTLQGNPLPGWTVYGGYGFNETEVVEANEPDAVGKRFRNAPKHSLSMISRYEFLAGVLNGLAVSLNARYQGIRYADPANTLALPSFTTVDLGATYPLGSALELGVFGKNLTDEQMWSGFVANAAMPSNGRTWLIRLTYTAR